MLTGSGRKTNALPSVVIGACASSTRMAAPPHGSKATSYCTARSSVASAIEDPAPSDWLIIHLDKVLSPSVWRVATISSKIVVEYCLGFRMAFNCNGRGSLHPSRAKGIKEKDTVFVLKTGRKAQSTVCSIARDVDDLKQRSMSFFYVFFDRGFGHVCCTITDRCIPSRSFRSLLFMFATFVECINEAFGSP